MGPDIQNVERGSQATPLAEDFLAKLQGQLSSEAFGTGVGPLQRLAGANIGDVIAMLQGGGTAGRLRDDSAGLVRDVEAGAARRGAEGRANIIESVSGSTGDRFGSAVARGVGDFEQGAQLDLNQLISQILFEQSAREQSAREFDIGALLQAIGGQQAFGEQNTGTFERFSMAGILPEEIIASPGIGSQILNAGLQAGAASLGAPPGFAPQVGGGVRQFPGQTSNLPGFTAPQFFPTPGTQPSGLGLSGGQQISPFQLQIGG